MAKKQEKAVAVERRAERKKKAESVGLAPHGDGAEDGNGVVGDAGDADDGNETDADWKVGVEGEGGLRRGLYCLYDGLFLEARRLERRLADPTGTGRLVPSWDRDSRPFARTSSRRWTPAAGPSRG